MWRPQRKLKNGRSCWSRSVCGFCLLLVWPKMFWVNFSSIVVGDRTFYIRQFIVGYKFIRPQIYSQARLLLPRPPFYFRGRMAGKFVFVILENIAQCLQCFKMAPYKKKCCNHFHNAWNCSSTALTDLAKKGGFQEFISAFQSMKAPGTADIIGTVFCFDCLAKCREKRSFTQFLPPKSDKLETASEKVIWIFVKSQFKTILSIYGNFKLLGLPTFSSHFDTVVQEIFPICSFNFPRPPHFSLVIFILGEKWV